MSVDRPGNGGRISFFMTPEQAFGLTLEAANNDDDDGDYTYKYLANQYDSFRSWNKSY